MYTAAKPKIRAQFCEGISTPRHVHCALRLHRRSCQLVGAIQYDRVVSHAMSRGGRGRGGGGGGGGFGSRGGRGGGAGLGGPFGGDDLKPDYSVTELFPVRPQAPTASSRADEGSVATTPAGPIRAVQGRARYRRALPEPPREDPQRPAVHGDGASARRGRRRPLQQRYALLGKVQEEAPQDAQARCSALWYPPRRSSSGGGKVARC